MPIRAEERARYPKDWPAISAQIRERADNRCECEGECMGRAHLAYASHHGFEALRCPNRHGETSWWSVSRVVLTTAHLDHTPENCEPENLRAMCQSCHLNYDRAHHAETRAATLARRKEHA